MRAWLTWGWLKSGLLFLLALLSKEMLLDLAIVSRSTKTTERGSPVIAGPSAFLALRSMFWESSDLSTVSAGAPQIRPLD